MSVKVGISLLLVGLYGHLQQEMAAHFDISQRAYADWERNPVALRPDQIEKLIEILEVSPDYFFGKGSE